MINHTDEQINLIPIPAEKEIIPIRRERDIYDLHYFESDLTRVLNAYREMRDITAKQGETIETIDDQIQTTMTVVKKGEEELKKADEEDGANKRRKLTITSGIITGTLLTGLVVGAQFAVPVAVVGGIVGWSIRRK